MTEQDAINALLGEFENAGETQEAQEIATAGQLQENTPTLSKDDISEAMLNAMQKMRSTEQEQTLNAQAQAQDEAKRASEREILEQLGLSELAGATEQIKAMQAQMAQQAEEARRQNVFNQNISMFEKEFPTINPQEFGEFAKTHGFDGYLGEDYNLWRLVANTMLQVATPKNKPDEIIGNGGGKNEISAFERIKKGEEVSDIEIGAELLRGL
ncbi:HIT family hydrolase [Campylobacter gastrosuis]|uniref:HIT family hydrolase n=1 Tax=Campylobacter gastrosuis TaxID=2974576 RepID=A0ABT7HT14_9BACT|nr:HIT family hydrolase [Campylobacter gastrosuis]MDL0090071.1 HIT family hydrolase [Campylobacter gastrosuis]